MHSRVIMALILWACIFLPACRQQCALGTKEKITYPVTRKVEQIDDYFGVTVADPYRWLEDDGADEVKKWVFILPRNDSTPTGAKNSISLRKHPCPL